MARHSRPRSSPPCRTRSRRCFPRRPSASCSGSRGAPCRCSKSADDGDSWVLVEVQLDEDKVKARKWPLAVAALWNERGVPGDLIVITADRAVAVWAQTVGRMTGPLGCALAVQPVVVQLTGDVAEVLLD